MEVKDNETIGLKSIIVRYLLHWKLFLGVFLFSIIPAVLYLIYYPRTYEMMARIQIQEDKDLGGGSFGLGEAAGLMKSFGLGSVSGGVVNIDDELMTLTSNKMLRDMVLKLGVNVDYCEPFSLGYRLYDESPLRMVADSATNARLAEAVEFSVFVKNGKAEVSAESVNMKRNILVFHHCLLRLSCQWETSSWTLHREKKMLPLRNLILHIILRGGSQRIWRKNF